MKLVTVIPIARGIFKDVLTYWSSKDVSLGAVVGASVRGRKINALVVGIEEVGDAKANIKAAPFALKKIEELKPNVFLPQFVRAAQRTASYFAAPLGGIIQSLVPKSILDSPPLMVKPKPQLLKPLTVGLKIDKLAFQSEDDDRLAAYKSLVREEFARKYSVFICFPTIEDLKRTTTSFEKGIKEYAITLHSGLSKKEVAAGWKKAVSEKHPVVILATASFLSIPREDIKTIVLEKENSRSWKTIARPGIDLRTFLEYYAEENGSKLIFGDAFLRAETLYRYNEHEILPFTVVKFRSLSTAEGAVVDMKKYRSENTGKTFTVLSNELKMMLELNRRDHGRLALVVGRRGLAGVTACSDCGTLAVCGHCGSPLVLHIKKGKRIFLCHKCGSEKIIENDGEEKCRNCGGWRLMPLGVGIERVLEELSSEFPGLHIFRVDSDTTKNEKVIRKTIADFYSTEGSVLLCTEMAIPYMDKPIEASALLGIDSLLAIPDFRINEKIFSLILSLRAKTQKTILIQTQESERELFDYALKGDILSFYRGEIAERKMFGYPPFTVLIKISWESKPERAEKEIGDIAGKLEGYDLRQWKTQSEGAKSAVKAHILIKIPKADWVDEKLLVVLKKLPPNYSVSIDPESIL